MTDEKLILGLLKKRKIAWADLKEVWTDSGEAAKAIHVVTRHRELTTVFAFNEQGDLIQLEACGLINPIK